MRGQAQDDGLIRVDEVGLAYGRVGDHSVRAAYRTIFTPRGDVFEPAMLAGLARASLGGRPRSLTALLECQPAEARLRLHFLCRALAVCNLRSHGPASLPLLVMCDGAGDSDALGLFERLVVLAEELDPDELDPSRLMLGLPLASAAADPARMQRLSDRLRATGARVALAGFGPDGSAIGLVDRIDPALISLGEAWFRRIAAAPEALRLLTGLVGAFRGAGRSVLVGAIAAPAELDAAIECGANLLDGGLLARPVLAGRINEPKPIGRNALMHDGAEIVPLFAGAAGAIYKRR
jgi:EAL domain-containing protein (putative c-di-GMP-specific phosphodiesterase class I)